MICVLAHEKKRKDQGVRGDRNDEAGELSLTGFVFT